MGSDPAQLDMLRGLQACNYSAMGALAFTTWDMAITIDNEVGEIWKKPWTRLKSLYLFLRYFSFGSQLLFVVIYMRWSAGLNLSPSGCRKWVLLQSISSQILMIGVQIILILRVRALYNTNKILCRLLPIFFFSEMLTMTVLLSLKADGIRYGPQCVIIHFPPAAVGFFLPPILLDTLLFLLTMAKFYQSLRDGWGQVPVITRFMTDGIWAFALPFLILVVNTFCITLLDGALTSVACSWVIAIPGFAGYRLILNMSHLLRSPHPGEYTTGLEVDTLPMSYELETTNCQCTSSYESYNVREIPPTFR
jgi:hypothetical protein